MKTSRLPGGRRVERRARGAARGAFLATTHPPARAGLPKDPAGNASPAHPGQRSMERHSTTLPWIATALSAGTLFVASTLFVQRLGNFDQRLDGIENARATQASNLKTGLDAVQGELAGIRSDLSVAFEQVEGNEALAARLEHAEARLGNIGRTVEAQTSNLVELEEIQASFRPDLERELDERLQRRWETLNDLVTAVQQTANESRQEVERLDRSIAAPRDLPTMWRELVGPIVQLAGETSVGSGVLLPSRPAADGGFQTFVITAWHVVRDIQGDPPDLDAPVPVLIYLENGGLRSETAKLLRHDAKLDAALLEVRTSEAVANGARLAPRQRLDDVRIFEEVYAVGCPLGNDPIPTRGEVATCHHEVDGETYWMINAPTYIGNSGGGIFDSKTHELLGIFSKIYTHGSLRPTIIPHMGLVTPLPKIYDWLTEVGFSEIVPASGEPEKVAATH